MRDPNSMISSLRAWSYVADFQTIAAEHALLNLAGDQPVPVLPNDPEPRADILLVQLLRERDRFRRALAMIEQFIDG